MALSKNNPLTKGLSGMLGGTVVFKIVNGKTIISNRPKKPTKESPLQKDNRNRFRMATDFAKSMMKDPVKKAEYREKALELGLTNAYTAAITEYMRKSEIKEINVEEYKGKKGNVLKVEVIKKGFKVQEVEVLVSDAVGKVIQSGKCVETNLIWEFTSLENIEYSGRYKVLARVLERTGNLYEKSIDLIIT
jgi:hypothetical protein